MDSTKFSQAGLHLMSSDADWDDEVFEEEFDDEEDVFEDEWDDEEDADEDWEDSDDTWNM